MINTSQLIILSLSLAFCGPVMAKIYKWVDIKGNTHYTAQPPSVKTQSNEEVKIKKIPSSSRTYQQHIAPKPVTDATTNKKKNTSMNLVYAAQLAKKKGLQVISLIGKSGGILKRIVQIL